MNTMKIMHIRYSLIPFLSMLLPLCVPAQPRTLTLSEALHIADEQSIDIRQARAALQRASTTVAQERTGFLPELSASGNYFYNLQRQVLFVAPDVPFNETGTTQAFPIGSRVTTGVSVNLTQPLYDPLVSARVDAAEATTRVAQAQLELARRLVRMNAEKAYYRALYAQSSEQMRQQQIQEALKNLELTVIRLKGGRAMPLDTLTANASLAQARADAETAHYDYLAAKLALARLLDLSNYEDLEVSGDLELPLPPGPSGGEMINPDARAPSREERVAEAQRIAAEAELSVQGSTALPSIDAVANMNFNGQSNDLNPADYKWAMTSQVGITLYYPIFNLWKNDPRQEEARFRIEEAKLEIERIRKQDSAQVEELMLTLRGVRARLRAEETSLAQAEKALEIANVLYKEGRATQLDVESAQSRLIDARLRIEKVKLEFLESYAELKALVVEE